MTNTTQFNFIVTYLQVQTAKLLSIHMQNTGSQSQWGICRAPFTKLDRGAEHVKS